MERKDNSEEFKIHIESLAKKLVNGESIDQVMAIQKIAKSFLPVDLDFYKIYVEFYKDPFNYPTSVGNPRLVYEILDTYFSTIANNSDPSFGNEIYEAISRTNEYDFDKLIAANSNPSISVKLLREIGDKKYDPVKVKMGVDVATDTYIDNQVDAFFAIFKRQEDYDSRLSFGNKIELRKEKLQKFLNPGNRSSLKWIVKANILKRQQLLLKKFTDVFGGEIDPIYQNLDKYDVLETCSELANILYPPNNAPGRITADRRFEETAMDIINPGNKYGIPNLIAQMEVYINGLNIAQKNFFGKKKLLNLCTALVMSEIFIILKPNFENDKYGIKGVWSYCLSDPFYKKGNIDIWTAFSEYVQENPEAKKLEKQIIESSNRSSYNLSDPVAFNQADLSYENPDVRSDIMERILLSLQKDRNFLRNLLEELLKEPLPTSEQILFAENTELEAQKLSEPSKQEEIWYRDIKRKIFQEDLTGYSKQEEIKCRNLVEKLKDNPLEYFWKESCVDIDKLFAGNKRILILLNPDLKNEEDWVRPNWQLRGCWEDLKSKYESKSQEEIDYTKYSFVTNQLLLRLSRNYETILNEFKLDNEELAGLLNLEIMRISKVVESLKIIFVD
jgi:hypothetical protein